MLDRDLVHKRLADNVFVEAHTRRGEREFTSHCVFVTAHGLYNDTPSGLSGSGYVVEVARQANIALCHEFFEVPLTAGFLVTAIDWRFTAAIPFVVEALEPFEVRTEIVDAVTRRGALAKISARSRLFDRKGSEFFAGEASFLITSRSLTKRAQHADGKQSLGTPLTPASVQVFRSENVFISAPLHETEAPDRHALIVDTAHPYFFEHENSHVPGMLLLEAAKQAAVFSGVRRFPIVGDCYGDLYRGEARFGRFAELLRPTTVSCVFGRLSESEEGFTAPVDIEFEQAGRELGYVRGAIAFMDQAEAVARSAIRRDQLDAALAAVTVDVPMNWAFQ